MAKAGVIVGSLVGLASAYHIFQLATGNVTKLPGEPGSGLLPCAPGSRLADGIHFADLATLPIA